MSFQAKLRFPDDEDSEQGFHRDSTTQYSSECTPENSKNPPSEPDFDDELFPESLYDNIEEFLDAEGLFLSTKSPILTSAQLKPSINIKQMNPFGLKTSISNGMSLTQEDIQTKALPNFLARRAISAGLKIELDI